MIVFSPVLHIIASLSIVSEIFIVAIMATWVLFNVRYNAKVVELGPTILTTIGIFGTFLGVALGLSHFDTTNVQASVPDLLAGLKTAFWASVFGVGAAVQLKLREFVAGMIGARKGAAQAASPLNVLVDIREALAGYGDASLPQQMRMLRQDVNDRLIAQITAARRDANERMDALRQGQREMVTQMEALETVQRQALYKLAANAGDTLVAALQRVVLSFNEKVASQFGENYRDLNQAVGQLLTWQNDYRATIKAMTDQLADTLRQLGYAASDFRTVTTGSERFAQTAERVALVMDGIEAGEQRMNVFAQSLCKLTEEASGRIPFIESRLYELTTQMTGAVQANQTALGQALAGSASDLQQAIRSAQGEFIGISREGAAQLQANQQAIAAALQANAGAMTQALQSMQQDMLTAVGAFEAQMEAMIRRSEQRVIDFDEAAASGLSKSVGNLIGQLSAQLDAAGTGVAERAPRPRPILHVVADATAAAAEE